MGIGYFSFGFLEMAFNLAAERQRRSMSQPVKKPMLQLQYVPSSAVSLSSLTLPKSAGWVNVGLSVIALTIIRRTDRSAPAFD